MSIKIGCTWYPSVHKKHLARSGRLARFELSCVHQDQPDIVIICPVTTNGTYRAVHSRLTGHTSTDQPDILAACIHD